MKPIIFPAYTTNYDEEMDISVFLEPSAQAGDPPWIIVEQQGDSICFHWRQGHLLIEAVEKAVAKAQRSEPNG